MPPLAAAPHAADFTTRRRTPSGGESRSGAGWVLAAIIVLAIALRLLAWSSAAQLAADGPDVLWQAERLQAGDIPAALSHPYPPLYAMSVAAVARLTGDLALAGALVSMLAGVLIVLAVHGLARLALPDRRDVACGAALLAALFQHGLLVTANVTSDGLFLALFLMAMLLLFDAEQSGQLRLRLFGVGLFLGLAWLTRAEGAFLLLPVVFWLVAGMVRREARRHRPLPPRGMYFASGALCLLGLALFVAPYAALVHDVSDGWGAGVADLGGLRSVETSAESATSATLSAAAATAAPEGSPLASPRVGQVSEREDLPPTWWPPPAERIALALESRGAPAARPAESVESAESAASASSATSAEAKDSATEGATADSATTPGATPDATPGATPADKPAAPSKPPRSSRPIRRFLQDSQLYLAAVAEAAATLGRELRLDLLLLAALGLPTVLRRRLGLLAMLALLLAGWVALAAVQLVTQGHLGPRDLLGPALLVLPLAGAGLAWLWGAASVYRGRPAVLRWAGRVPVMLLVAGLAGTTIAAAIAPSSEATARVAALDWVREHSVPDEHIAAGERRDGWTAQRPLLVVGLPVDEELLLAELARLDVRLLVLRLDDVRRHAPDWLAQATFIERARFGEGADTVLVLERRTDAG